MLAAKNASDPKSSDNLDSGDDYDENNKRNRVTIHETDPSLYNENGLAASFLSNQKTSSFSAANSKVVLLLFMLL